MLVCCFGSMFSVLAPRSAAQELLQYVHSRVPRRGITLTCLGVLVGKWAQDPRLKHAAPSLLHFLRAHPDWFHVAPPKPNGGQMIRRADRVRGWAAAPPAAAPGSARFGTERELLEAMYARIPEGAGLEIGPLGAFVGAWGSDPLCRSLAGSLLELIVARPDWFAVDAGDMARWRRGQEAGLTNKLMVYRAPRPLAPPGPRKRPPEGSELLPPARRGRITSPAAPENPGPPPTRRSAYAL